MSVTVRPARVEDIPWMIGELKEFAVYYGTALSLYPDDEYARAGIYTMIKDHLVLIAERPGVGPIGFIAGVVQPHFYNPAIAVLVECWWWVVPAYRKSSAGARLLKAFTDWGNENCDWITMSLTGRTPIKDWSLVKRGFHEHERTFLMEVA